MQQSLRTARQTTSLAEEKRIDLEALAADSRSAERRLEEQRRALRELEGQVEMAREEATRAEVEREKVRRELAVLRHGEEELKMQMQVLRSAVEADSRAAEDARRKSVR